MSQELLKELLNAKIAYAAAAVANQSNDPAILLLSIRRKAEVDCIEAKINEIGVSNLAIVV